MGTVIPADAMTVKNLSRAFQRYLIRWNRLGIGQDRLRRKYRKYRKLRMLMAMPCGVAGPCCFPCLKVKEVFLPVASMSRWNGTYSRAFD